MAEENWGKHLKELRESRGLTQEQLAEKTGVSRSHIARMEVGQFKTTSQDTFARLAAAFDMGLDDFREALSGQRMRPLAETPEQILERLKLAQPISIPVFEGFHAGTSANPVGYVYLARPRAAGKSIEAYRISGDCLKPTVSNGDVVVIDRDGSIDMGDIIACVVDSEIRVARLKKIADELWLENNYGQTKLQDCQLAAPVIEVIKKLK